MRKTIKITMITALFLLAAIYTAGEVYLSDAYFDMAGANITNATWINATSFYGLNFYRQGVAITPNESVQVSALWAALEANGTQEIADNNTQNAEITTLENNLASNATALEELKATEIANNNTQYLEMAGYVLGLTVYIDDINTTGNIEGLGFVQGAHTIDTNESAQVATLNTQVKTFMLQNATTDLNMSTHRIYANLTYIGSACLYYNGSLIAEDPCTV